jgi:hypothetical protein
VFGKLAFKDHLERNEKISALPLTSWVFSDKVRHLSGFPFSRL